LADSEDDVVEQLLALWEREGEEGVDFGRE